jgi:hypothetical protein
MYSLAAEDELVNKVHSPYGKISYIEDENERN